MTNRTDNTKAVNAFIGHIGDAEALVAKLKDYIESHFETLPEAVNWGDVGTAQETARRLRELSAFLGLVSEA